ncbi:hypothetical protein B0H13DRAFT_2365953 [Mycena leptocephala]|nr:hypothetical protein B0H13DRAFT_2365953 [Mycena leptocephala]
MATAPFMAQQFGQRLHKRQTVSSTYRRPQVTTFFLVIVVIVVVATMVCRRVPLVDEFPRPPHIRMDLPDVRGVIHSNGDD